jgi:hypothetical protein
VSFEAIIHGGGSLIAFEAAGSGRERPKAKLKARTTRRNENLERWNARVQVMGYRLLTH